MELHLYGIEMGHQLDSKLDYQLSRLLFTVKILKFGTPQTIGIIVLKKEKFDVTLH